MTKLTGITWEHSRGYDPMVATAHRYEREHPHVSINWEQRSLQAFAGVPVEQLAAQYDLLVIDHPHVGNIAQAPCLVALDQIGRNEDLEQLADQSVGPSFSTYEYDGHLWALPIDAAAQVASYRPDLIDTVPKTWNQVMSLAESGRVILPIKPVDSLMCFFTLAVNHGASYRTDGSDGLLMARSDALNALNALKRLADLVPKECLSMNPIEVYDRMCLDDQFVYCPLAYGYSNYARTGYRDRMLRFADIPAFGAGGPCGSTIGGTGIAISKRCVDVETAVDYAFWIASPECQKTTYFDSGGQPASATAWEDERINRASNDFFRDTRLTLNTAHVRPRYPGYLHLQDDGGDTINTFLSGHMSAENCVDKIETIYRRSLRSGTVSTHA